jgi:uncharacterized iron-regulated protein
VAPIRVVPAVALRGALRSATRSGAKSALLLCILLLGACVSSSGRNSQSWQSELATDHPLVGKIWISSTGEFVDPSALYSRIEGAKYILLGEKHDNPDHHALQLLVLNRLLSAGGVERVAFEMMDSNSQSALVSLSSQPMLSLDQLKGYLDWDTEGWDWNFYGPLIDAVYRADVDLAAANINSESIGRVYAEELPATIAAVLDAATVEQLERDIDESHCGMLPQSQFPAMVRVQQSRDYAMAQSLVLEQDSQAVLIAGNYHIRRDLGVPNYLLAQETGLSEQAIVALSFMEVQAGETEPAAYLQQYGTRAAYDYIWFTPAVSSEDYCASLRGDADD